MKHKKTVHNFNENPFKVLSLFQGSIYINIPKGSARTPLQPIWKSSSKGLLYAKELALQHGFNAANNKFIQAWEAEISP